LRYVYVGKFMILYVRQLFVPNVVRC